MPPSTNTILLKGFAAWVPRMLHNTQSMVSGNCQEICFKSTTLTSPAFILLLFLFIDNYTFQQDGQMEK